MNATTKDAAKTNFDQTVSEAELRRAERRAEREAFRKDPVGFYFEQIEKEFKELKSDDFDALIAAKTALKLCLSNSSEKGNVGLAARDIVRAHGSEPEDLVAAIYGHLLEVRAGKLDLRGNSLAMPGCGETLITQMSPSNRLNFVDCGDDGGGDDGDGGGGCCADDDDDADDSSGYASTEILMSESKYVGQEMRLSADCMREAIKQIAAALKVKSDTVQGYVLKTIRHQAMQLKLVREDKVERQLSKKQAVEHIESFCCKTALSLITGSVDKQIDLLSRDQLCALEELDDCEKVLLSICAMGNALPDLIEMGHEGRLGVLKKMASAANAALRVRYTVAGIQKPKRGRRARVQVQQIEALEALEVVQVQEQPQEQELVQEPVQARQLEPLEPVHPEALEPVQALEAPAHEQEQEPVQARQPDQVPVQMPALPEPEPEPAPMPKPTPERLAEQLELFAAEVADAAIARARKRAKRTTPAPASLGWVQEQLALDLCSTELADAAIAQAKASASAELVRVMARVRDRVTERIADAELRCKADQTRAPPGRRRKRKGVAMAAH